LVPGRWQKSRAKQAEVEFHLAQLVAFGHLFPVKKGYLKGSLTAVPWVSRSFQDQPDNRMASNKALMLHCGWCMFFKKVPPQQKGST